MTRYFIAVAVLSLFASCSVDRGTPATRNSVSTSTTEDVSRETFALGTSVTPEGAIPKDAAGAAFKRGGEIFLSVDVAGASTDQNIEVQWLDAHGRALMKQQRHVREGERYAVFPSGRTSSWRLGQHRALVIIDGRVVSERPFAVM